MEDVLRSLDRPVGRLARAEQEVAHLARIGQLPAAGADAHADMSDGLDGRQCCAHGDFLSYLGLGGHSSTSAAPPPVNWLSLKITNSAGFTGAMPTSHTT